MKLTMCLAAAVSILALTSAASIAKETEKLTAEGKRVFSPLSAKDLFGKKVRIPQDLKSRKSCVIIAFEREQQDTIDTWIPYLLKLEKEKNDFKFYEVPVIQASYKPVRWFIDGAMAKSIKTSEGKKRTLTSYTDVSRFVKLMKLDKKKITIFVLADDGSVLAQENGEFDQQKAERLSSVI